LGRTSRRTSAPSARRLPSWTEIPAPTVILFLFEYPRPQRRSAELATSSVWSGDACLRLGRAPLPAYIEGSDSVGGGGGGGFCSWPPPAVGLRCM
jgi:hypothetical protein